MPGFQHFPEGQIILFALVLLRISAFVLSWPVFGVSNIPNMVKILLSLCLAITMFPLVKVSKENLAFIDEHLIMLAIREVAVGLMLGFLLRMLFQVTTMAGDLISNSIGLNSAQMFNPAAGIQSTVVETFHVMLCTLVFLGINGHHLFIQGLAESLNLIPVGIMKFNFEIFGSILNLGQHILVTALKMGSPVVVAIFVANLAMGVLGKAVPQINVLVTSLPVTIGVGFMVIWLIIPYLLAQMNWLATDMGETLFTAMKGF